MLPFYSMVLEYFVNFKRIRCYFGYYGCYTIMTIEVRDLGTGMSSFLVALLVLELVCSIGSVVLSCRAYSKYCNTCNIRDCCTCLGCCECDCVPLNISQAIHLFLYSLLRIFCKTHRTSGTSERAKGNRCMISNQQLAHYIGE